MNSLTLRKAFTFFIAIDVVFALMMAVVNGLVLNQAGISIGANGIATTVAAGGTFIGTFFSSLFVGGIFLIFTCILLGLWLLGYGKLTQNADEKSKRLITKAFMGVFALVAGWGLLQSVTQVALVVGLGTAPAIHASALVLTVVGFCVGVLTFALSAWMGLVFATVLAGFAFVIMVLLSVVTGAGKGKAGGGNGGAGTGTDTDTDTDTNTGVK